MAEEIIEMWREDLEEKARMLEEIAQQLTDKRLIALYSFTRLLEAKLEEYEDLQRDMIKAIEFVERSGIPINTQLYRKIMEQSQRLEY